jgi:hypothetical protein
MRFQKLAQYYLGKNQLLLAPFFWKANALERNPCELVFDPYGIYGSLPAPLDLLRVAYKKEAHVHEIKFNEKAVKKTSCAIVVIQKAVIKIITISYDP